jgi:hypothetical protein
MAQTYDPRYFAELPSPEEGLRRIKKERTRKSAVAVVLYAAAAVATLGAVYLAYADTPAPANPANERNITLEPYR